MKVVILAGGLPSTISEERGGIPKPMAEIGDRPLLWHIMKLFSFYGFREFIICGGYKVNLIKEYFKDYYIYQSDITIDLKSNEITVHRLHTEDWKVTVVDTGLDTTTGDRIKQVRQYIGDEDFIVTYGDCLSNLNIEAMVSEHRNHRPQITMAVARPTGRNSVLSIEAGSGLLTGKGDYEDAWVNASCYVFSGRIHEELCGRELDESFMTMMAKRAQVMTYRHEGFWSPVETKRVSNALESMWNQGNAPWKVWND